jgi:hypothetical protein
MCQSIIVQFKCSHTSDAYPPVELFCAQHRSTMARAKENNQAVSACPNYTVSTDVQDSYCPDCQRAGRGA